MAGVCSCTTRQQKGAWGRAGGWAKGPRDRQKGTQAWGQENGLRAQGIGRKEGRQGGKGRN
eukprot:359787-Chlamydomonas_euryale.AAC.11